MPTYDYRCTKCGAIFSGQREIEDRYDISCPECQTCRVEIQLQALPFVLKGTGWAKDGYK